VRQDGDHVALHLVSLGAALYRVKRLELSAAELRGLVTFGWRRFGADDDRRRVIVLHEPTAREFVGARKKAVPFR
jgi:hypothetical protein